LASISSEFAALSERSFQKQHTTCHLDISQALSNRNATVRGDLDATFSLPPISLCLHFLLILSLVYISTRFGIHDFYDHLLRGTTVPIHHVLGFESHDIRLLHAARARASLVHSTITSFTFLKLGRVLEAFRRRSSCHLNNALARHTPTPPPLIPDTYTWLCDRRRERHNSSTLSRFEINGTPCLTKMQAYTMGCSRNDDVDLAGMSRAGMSPCCFFI
jgi:hypothetical protein